MSDKKISELAEASVINQADVSVLVSGGTNYKFAFSTLLQFLGNNLSVGANISFGTTLPQNTTGKDRDLFINTTTGSFAQKISGTWSVVYTLPANNTQTDTTILYGLGMPAMATGNNGDTYINTGTGIFYKKIAGAWTQVFSMQSGPSGPQGTAGINGTNGTNGFSILNGNGSPSNLGTGVNGDFYINTSNYTFFGPKAGGTWGQGVSLVPPGVSPGGDSGQVLVKASEDDYDTKWLDFNTLYVQLSGSYNNPSWISSLAWNKITGTPTTIAGYGITNFDSLGDAKWVQLSDVNVANGWVQLNSSTKIDAAYLPSYVSDIVTSANFAALPNPGTPGFIYITADNNKEYRWNAGTSSYIELSPSPGTTDALAEGAVNKYFTDVRVAAYGDSHYITTNTIQTGLTGSKTTTGSWTFGGVSVTGIVQVGTSLQVGGSGTGVLRSDIYDFNNVQFIPPAAAAGLAGNILVFDAVTKGSGYIPSSTFVPYSGAVSNIEIGNHQYLATSGANQGSLSSTSVGVSNGPSSAGINPDRFAIATSSNGHINYTIDTIERFNNANTASIKFQFPSITTSQIITLPDGTGTLALISDIPSNYITINTTQTGLTGDKTSNSNWTFNKVTAAGIFTNDDSRQWSPSLVYDWGLLGLGSVGHVETQVANSRPVCLAINYEARPVTTVTDGTDYHGVDLTSEIYTNANASTRLYPFESAARFRSTNAADVLGKLVGGYFQVNNMSPGAVNSAVSVRILAQNVAGGNIVDGRGIDIDTPTNTNGSTMGTYTGVYIASLNSVSTTTAYGIYSDNANNLFKGIQIIPATNSTVGLNISGSSSQTADLLEISSNALDVFRIDKSGRIGLGATVASGTNLYNTAPMSGGISSNAQWNLGVVQSTTTGRAVYYRSESNLQAATFNITEINGFRATQGTFGAGSTATKQVGYYADPTLIGAVTNIGFESAIQAGTNRWNFYSDGTANNAFLGNTRFGSLDLPTNALDITGSTSATGQFIGLGTATTSTSNAIGYQAGTAGNIYHYRATAGQDYINIRSSVANHETRIGIMPNGTFVPATANTQIAGFKIFGADFTADETNNNDFGVYTTSNSNRFNSKHNGTGASLPFMWSLQDTQIMMNLDVNGYLGVGSPSSTAFTPNTRIFGNSNTSAPATPDLTNSITIGVGNANATNKYLGQIGFLSADSDFTAPKMVAYIQAEATENYAGNTAVGSKMTFFTGTNAGTNAVARMQLDNLGNIILNNYTTQSGLLYVNNTTGTVAQTAQGAANTVLHGNGTSAPTFSSIVTADMANNAVTYSKMQAMTTNRLLGSGTGIAVSEIAVSGTQGVSITHGSGTLAIGLGAITPTSVNGVSAATIAFVDATSSIQAQLNAKQAALSGTGFVKSSGGTISYDNSTYLSASTAASTLQPIENQRLSTSNSVAFSNLNAFNITTTNILPTSTPGAVIALNSGKVIVAKDILDSVSAFVGHQIRGIGFIQEWQYSGSEVAHIETDGTFVSNANIHASGNIEVSGHVQGGKFKLSSLSSAPSSSSDTGTTGEFTFDSGYIYLCISANTWTRAALTTF